MPRLTIDSTYLVDRLRALLATPSPTGYTDTIVLEASAELRRLGVAFDVTRRGAIRAFVPGKEPKPARAIVSHLDTLGAQVKLLKDNGRLEVVPVGTWSARFAEGAGDDLLRARRLPRNHPAAEGLRPHLRRRDRHIPDRLAVRRVARRRGRAQRRRPEAKLGIDVGDMVAIDPQPEFLENGFIVSRHLDDKAGAAVMFAALEALVSAKRRSRRSTPTSCSPSPRKSGRAPRRS
jgi:putative aminopeptidase FrvX